MGGRTKERSVCLLWSGPFLLCRAGPGRASQEWKQLLNTFTTTAEEAKKVYYTCHALIVLSTLSLSLYVYVCLHRLSAADSITGRALPLSCRHTALLAVK
uniref:Uncharacterized protein n=1 Tax=Anopheles darlingi TaxID=43151 RepID=A0A2M4DDQ9_ANODA